MKKLIVIVASLLLGIGAALAGSSVSGGYGGIAVANEPNETKSNGYAAELSFPLNDQVNLDLGALKSDVNYALNIGISPSFKAFEIPFGASYLDFDDATSFSIYAGAGFRFWKSQPLGLRIGARYHYAVDEIAGETGFLDARAMISLNF